METDLAVFFYGCITLDGYLATRAHDLSWLYDTGTTEGTSYDAFYSHMDITLMGRRTFEEIEKMEDPAAYPTTEYYVFTHGALACPGFTAVTGDPVEFVKELRDNNRSIWVVGGNTILAPLLGADMVDHLIIQIAPVLLGAGVPLFTQKELLRRFRLTSVKQYGPFAELAYCRNGATT